MGWDFATDPEFQAKLDWADRFVTDECEPLDLAFEQADAAQRAVHPLPVVQFGGVLHNDRTMPLLKLCFNLRGLLRALGPDYIGYVDRSLAHEGSACALTVKRV